MPDISINIPIRQEDAEDVLNAFAFSYNYPETINIGNDVYAPNPLSKEQFVQQCCVNFMLNITKNYMIKVEEIAARSAATELAATRAAEVTAWFDNNRLDSIGGIAIYQNFPQIQNSSYNLNQGSSVTFDLQATDPDNLPLTFTITQQPAGGLISGTLPEVIYTPYEYFSGGDTIKYKANNGTKNSLEGTISLVVNGKPIASSQSISTNMNEAVSITLSGLDPENAVITYTISDNPTNGILSGIAPDLTYTPNQDVHGSDSFTFTVNDGVLTSDEGIITITINGKPLALSQSMSTVINTPVLINLSGTDPENDQLQYNIIDIPNSGSLSGSAPSITYTPNTDYIGFDSFTFTVNDGNLISDPATISITISEN